MDDKKVSAIIPVYNSEEYIEKCLKSVIPQVDEVIIVNDCTPDNSMEIVNRYKNNRKIKIFNLKENKGLGYVRNFGAKKAKYPFLLYIDSDQILSERWVEKGLKYFKEKDVVYVGGLRPNPCNTYSEKLMHILRMNEINKADYPERMSDAVFLVKRDIVLKCGFYQHIKRGGTEKLFDCIKEKGLKVRKTNLKSVHLGEPKTFYELLKRQWKYGKEQLFIERSFSLEKFIKMTIALTPFGILPSFPLYRYVIREKIMDIFFILTLPMAYWIFMFTYYLSYLITLLGLRGNWRL